MPGMGHIADIYLYVDANTPSGSSYSIEVDKIVADSNSIGMFTEMISSSVFVGTPMAYFSIDTSFSMSGSATRTIPVYLDNIVPISVFEMTLMDMPDGLIVTSVNPVGRFSDVGGLFLDNTYNPTVTGNSIIVNKMSYLNCIAVSANPRKNLEYSISITSV